MKPTTRSRWVAAAATCALLAGCTLAPKYQRPASPVAVHWPDAAAAPAAPSPEPYTEIGWQRFFGDPRLREIIRLALENNRDLRIAALNVEQVRAEYRIARLAFIPAVDGTAGMSRGRNAQVLTPPNTPVNYTQYTVGADISSYELDLFGRVRSLRAQALETFFATEEARRSVHLSLVAQVADQYLNQRAIAEELKLAESTLQAVQASFQLTQRRYNVGASSRLDLATAETQVQNATAEVSAFRQQLAQADNALALLVGHALPDNLPPPLPLDAQNLLTDLSPGLPSDLLERRPDILQAEHELKAANANIGAARAAFFPKITLTAAIGTASTELSDLFGAGTGTWSFVPRATVPLFDAGRNRATLDIAKLQKLVEVARYEQAIQTAFREVSDALVVRARIDEQVDAYDALARAQQTRYTLAQARYRQGVDSYLAVLIAQQDLYAAQVNQIRTRFAKCSNLVALYRALGGGWSEQSPRATP